MKENNANQREPSNLPHFDSSAPLNFPVPIVQPVVDYHSADISNGSAFARCFYGNAGKR